MVSIQNLKTKVDAGADFVVTQLFYDVEAYRTFVERCRAAGVPYFPYVEREADAGKGLFTAFAKRAAVVVSDDFPSFEIPRMQAAAAAPRT